LRAQQLSMLPSSSINCLQAKPPTVTRHWRAIYRSSLLSALMRAHNMQKTPWHTTQRPPQTLLTGVTQARSQALIVR